jgi:hypothetical protein
MNVGIDQAGDHRAAAEVDHSRGRSGRFSKFFRTAGRDDPVTFDGKRLAHGRSGVQRDDLAVDEQDIRRIAPCRRRAKHAEHHGCQAAEQTASPSIRTCRHSPSH